MDEKIRNEIQKIYIDAILRAQKDVEEKYGVRTRIDFFLGSCEWK